MSPTPPSTSPDSLPKNWNVMVVSMVISGCTILLLISYYSIILRLCSRFRRQSNRTERRFLNEANPDDPSLQFHSHGLDSSIVHALPVVQFKVKKGEELESNRVGDDCAVCLGDFEDGDWVKHLPNCTHAFHVSCIDTWFESHSNCPLCRSNVFWSEDFEECPVSMRSLLETLRREDIFQERARHYQVLRSGVLQSLAVGHEQPANVT